MRIFSSPGFVGTGLAAIYPWAVTTGHEIGSIRAYDRGGAFRPVTVWLSPAEVLVRVLVDVTGVEGAGDHAPGTPSFSSASRPGAYCAVLGRPLL